jgi:hypothetical protein
VPDVYWSTPTFENPKILKSKFDYYDGIEFINEVDEKRIIVAFYPNQIKLADGINTTFDLANSDIRYEGGGQVKDYKGNLYKVNYFLDEWANPYEANGYPLNIVIYAKITKNGEEKLIGKLWAYLRDVKDLKLESKKKFVLKDILSKKYNQFLEIEDSMVIYEFQLQGLYSNLLKELSKLKNIPIVSFKWQRNGVSELFWKSKNQDNIINIKSNYIYYPINSRYDNGGEITDCKEYIMQNKSLFANGYFFDMQKISDIILLKIQRIFVEIINTGIRI